MSELSQKRYITLEDSERVEVFIVGRDSENRFILALPYCEADHQHQWTPFPVVDTEGRAQVVRMTTIPSGKGRLRKILQRQIT